MKARDIVIQISVSLVGWLAKQHPEDDIEATLLEELGEADNGLVITVGNDEFTIRVESTNG